MKLVAAGVALLLLSSAGAQAGIFSHSHSNDKLPKPIDHPIVRPKVREDHKVGKKAGRHPSEMQRSEYGAEWGRILKIKPAHGIPGYLYQGE
jgi:hypothetical protein